MIITDKAQIKIAELKESNNLRLLGSDELECYELIESDLKLPADTTFTRSSVAYLSDGTQVVANQPRFEQGKFGKAIMLEEGTTNLIRVYGSANPQFTDLTGWSWDNTKGSASIISSPDSVYGGRVLLYQDTDGNTSSNTWDGVAVSNGNPTGNISPGGTITMVIHYKTQNVTEGTVAVWGHWIGYDSNNNKVYDIVADWFIGSSNGVWVTKTTTMTTPSSSRYPNATYWRWSNFKIGFNLTNLGAQIYVDYVQLEAKPYATSFIDGTRSAETLEVPTEGILNPQEGTVECWVYIDDRFINGMANKFAWIWGTRVSPYYPTLNLFRNGLTNTLQFVSRDANNKQSLIEKPLSQISIGWHYIACTWKSSCLAFLLDGQLVGEVVNPYLPNSVDAQMYIGHNPSAGEQCNTLIDDLRISNKARSDEEILVAYQNNLPLLVDEWTTYKLDFDDKIRITAQGQIICNELIEI